MLYLQTHSVALVPLPLVYTAVFLRVSSCKVEIYVVRDKLLTHLEYAGIESIFYKNCNHSYYLNLFWILFIFNYLYFCCGIDYCPHKMISQRIIELINNL